ncbi:ion transporter [Luteolibacter sp. AS25]|uniref:ion transporter n=1 Tax=Luteolibacter sp. AS25 TaxID=3135776 RepID=UPI00398ABB5F
MSSFFSDGGDDGPGSEPGLRERIWRTIFLSDTKSGQIFDVILLILIGASVAIVMLESVETLRSLHGYKFLILEWFFTLIFTVEYGVRLWAVRKKRRYALSFFGIVDLLSILPTYVAIFFVGTQYLMVIRILRLLRMFRVLKMAHHFGQANVLMNALKSSAPKISVFLFFILTLVSIEGTLMYIVEGGSNPGFSSIPQSIYWAIVTVTTVGYGDVAPLTVVGKILSSVIMLSGFAIIAVPAGIVTAEIGRENLALRMDRRKCDQCGWTGHDPAAIYCKHCGCKLHV